MLAQYLFRINGHSPTDWELKGAAVAGYTVAVLRKCPESGLEMSDLGVANSRLFLTVVVFNTRLSYRLSNGIGIVKVATLVFIAVTGFVVLGGRTKVASPQANFEHSFQGNATPYGLTNALVKIIFSYAGYENAFNVVNEVKVCLEIPA